MDECFTTLAAALSTCYLDKAPHYMAYLRTIVRASQNFEGPPWVPHMMLPTAGWRLTTGLSIGQPLTQSLYNEAFTWRARVSDSHSSRDCTFGSEDFRHHPNRQPSPRCGAVRAHTAQICLRFNQPGGSQCRFKQCRYAHLCARYNRPHPVSECDRCQSRSPRSTSPTGKERET